MQVPRDADRKALKESILLSNSIQIVGILLRCLILGQNRGSYFWGQGLLREFRECRA